MTDTDGNDVEELAANSCWELLRDAGVGRLAVWVEDHPDIFPVNFVVDHGTLVFRSAEGTKIAAALTDVPVAVETDGYDESSAKAWSVVVKGRAERIQQVQELMDTLDLPLFPWQAGRKGVFVRVVPTLVTGRRFPVTDPGVWRTPLSETRRAPDE
ncbi:pyridoxamine 5'-phosphate oxidase family protein [Kocuria nitroreducens]|uniref:pyridoxamine 5'-phosphate oxidase family protein n=1 Tax=Kocuria nitroreducens TaxID=3058914 RepID=UPI0036D88EB0